MKICVKNPFTCLGGASTRSRVLPVLIAGLGLITAGPVAAQTFMNLYGFTPASAAPPYTNRDGANPSAGLVLSGDTLYGAAGDGGTSGNGTVFAISTGGTGFSNLYNFTATLGPLRTNSDGANPYSSLILSGNTLYGTAFDGGTNGVGTVFAISTNGTGFTNLYNFTGSDGTAATGGGNPASGLVLSGNALYGTAELGGNAGDGMIFRIYTDGTGFTNLHGFTGAAGGSFPQAGLILSGTTLYGTASSGGRGGKGGNGTVFAINTDGTGFTNIYRLDGSNDGAFPQAGLVLSGSTLYGTTEAGGISSNGTVFSLDTSGASFAVLHTFSATDPDSLVNGDGANPTASLILSGNTLYGATDYGGSGGLGTVFSVDTNGSNFMNLHSFAGGSGGFDPAAALVLGGNDVYGTTEFDGSGSRGTVFKLAVTLQHSAPPQPDIVSVTPSGSNLVIDATDGQSGGTYITLTSTILTLPLSQWMPVATNVLTASGDFTITLINAVNRDIPQRFYILETP
jgi:uncharacterized repeat protein (TIGR03803 family)